jgi:hypothetical protein
VAANSKSTQPNPVHWSKDFVEHLRTIHFALIATAAALVIVALTTKQYSMEVAKNELSKISELRSVFKPEELVKELPVDETDKNCMYNAPQLKIDSEDEKKYVEVNIAETIDLSWQSQSKSEWQILTVSFPPDRLEAYGSGSNDIGAPPTKLSSLIKWWDSSGGSEWDLYIPLAVQYKEPPYPPDAIAPLNHSNVKLKAGSMYEAKSYFSNKNIYMINDFNGSDFGSVFYGSTGKLGVILPTTLCDKFPINRKEFAKYLNVRDTDFRHSFYDLQQVADKFGLDDLSKLEDVLSKSEASDTAVFEAFGIKFPAEVATLGGYCALLGVQLYLYLYLRRPRRALKPSDPGWDVPWIGIDTSRLGKAVFFISVTLFPVVSLSLLGWSSALRLTLRHQTYFTTDLRSLISVLDWNLKLKLAALLIGIIFSAILGACCWKYRPQMAKDEVLPKDESEASIQTPS